MTAEFADLMTQPAVRAVLQRAARRLTAAGCSDAREDAEQELLLQLWRAFRSHPPAPPMEGVAWVASQVQQRTVDMLRRRRKEKPSGDMCSIVDPHDHVAEIDRRLDIEAALSRLPAELREIAQDLAAGYTPTEIADRLGIGRTTAWEWIQRLRGVLESI